ncbi:mandelate racemase/muconate lactonizing enzyme family protein [Thermasporomyces composti]|uniref:mandelate racemase/muconate lactonizing enzyme family protein n=1 Tax=Thermasporomyces composti TaxID=696763 RepID=UPI001FE2E006|nr:enolase C-terminal domain-like protein [Thermasporomyces composti]
MRVRTDQGGQGWGLAAGDLTDVAALVGRRVDELFDPKVGVVEALATPLDFALHDLAGRLLDQPVHQLLGGHGTRAVPWYDGAIYFDDLDPDEAPRGLDAVLANCRDDYALGFRAFKVKIGRGHRWMAPEAGRRRDVDVTRAVREAFPDCRILVDANDGYTCADVLDYLDAVADCDVFWLEEPFPENREDLRRLREHLADRGTLVADGESEPDVPFLLDLGKEGLLDVLLMDVVSFGLTRWRALMPRLAELGVRASPHAWGLPLKSLYAAQIAAGLGNVPLVEGVPGTTDGVDTSAYRSVDGVLHVPDAPGFGLDLLVDTTR